MKTYLDLTLLPNEGLGHYFLWGKLYQKMHLILIRHKTETNGSQVGLAFPQYKYDKGKAAHLGGKLRLITSQDGLLDHLDISKALQNLTDYIHVASIKPVPDGIAEYVCYSRARMKSNKERLARRMAKRQGIRYEEALDSYASFDEHRSDLPYIRMQSHSTGQYFTLFVKEVVVPKEQRDGEFSCYGLSRSHTVPKFLP